MKDIISREEMIGCSCVGKHPFSDVEDVIKEACIHQAEHTTKRIIEEIEKVENPYHEHNMPGYSNKYPEFAVFEDARQKILDRIRRKHDFNTTAIQAEKTK